MCHQSGCDGLSLSVGAVQMFNPCLSSLCGSGRIIDVKWMKIDFLMDGGSYVSMSSSSSEYFRGMFTALFLLLPERTRPDWKDIGCWEKFPIYPSQTRGSFLEKLRISGPFFPVLVQKLLFHIRPDALNWEIAWDTQWF